MKKQTVAATLSDPDVPLDNKKNLLMHLCTLNDGGGDAPLMELFTQAAASSSEELHAKKLMEVQALLNALQEDPLRQATYLRSSHSQEGVSRAQISFADGGSVFSILKDPSMEQVLRCGDSVIVDAKGRVILDVEARSIQPVGEEATFERTVGATSIEVTLRDHEKHVFMASASLLEDILSGEVQPGAPLLVCSRRQIAFHCVPYADDFSNFRYLFKGPVPDVRPERDIGQPHPLIDQITDHVRLEMMQPERRRDYGIRRSQMRFLTGRSGTGKSLAIRAVRRRIYEVMSEVTGVKIDDLPHRTFRFRAADILSKWVGSSDKAIAQFINEVLTLADQEFEAPDGTKHKLPVIAIGEEIEALTRQRGDDSVFDRILTTFLERFDPNSPELEGRLIVFLFTTNVPHLVDSAFLRRAGGVIDEFGPLTRSGFMSVSDKILRDVPLNDETGIESTQTRIKKRFIRDMVSWLYAQNGLDRGALELSLVGHQNPLVKYRRDFLTGSVIDRAVQKAAHEACNNEQLEGLPAGISLSALVKAIDQQVLSLVDQVTAQNATTYVTLPDGARVSSVKRIYEQASFPFELLRAS